VFQGIVKFQDSPLVRAAQDGSVLVVDEADKAPTQVTCILKVIILNLNFSGIKKKFYSHINDIVFLNRL
jgi:hypothetical protein